MAPRPTTRGPGAPASTPLQPAGEPASTRRLARAVCALLFAALALPVAVLGADWPDDLAASGVGAGAVTEWVVSSTGALPAASLVPAAAPPRLAPATHARAIRHGSRHRKVVALTFDDGYSATQTLAIVRILRAEGIKATFFPYAQAVRKAPAVWRQIAAAGHPIGNHTFSHPNLTRMTMAAVESQLSRARSVVRAVTGRTQPAIARPPYGAYSRSTRRAAAIAGYPTLVLWDVDTRDWSGISVSTLVARATRGTNGSIVLMHAGPRNTPRALAAIIRNYRARGFEFVTVPEMLGIPWP